MKYTSSFETPESIVDVLSVLQSHGAEVTSVTDQVLTFTISEDSEYDLGVAIQAITNDLIDDAGISVTVKKPVPVEAQEAPKSDTNDVTLVDLVNSISATSKDEAENLVRELKIVHTAIEDKLKRLAIDWELYISLGDYGYGRSIDGSNWNDSGCEWETSSEPDWQSSSYMC